MRTPRVAFLGSPEFAVPSLRRLARGAEVALVLTQPERPRGRGLRPAPTAVATAARDLGLPVEIYVPARRGEIEAHLAGLGLDALVVVAFGHILRPSTLAAAKRGALNVHASLLPRWRGVAPIERALLAGDAVTGATLMQLDAGVDTGPLLGQRILPIAPEDTRATLAAKLGELGSVLLGELLEPFVRGELPMRVQDETRATYAPRLEKEEGRIDWAEDPVQVWRQVRALHGWPGAFTQLGDALLKVHQVLPVDALPAAAPGTVVRADARRGVHVACGGGTIELVEVQLPGKSAVAAAALVAGGKLGAGMQLGAPEGGT
jgi:methionyl-tRNA formyltransferase